MLLDVKSYKVFVNDITTERTKKIYTDALLAYCNYKKVKNIDDLLKNRKNLYKIEDDIKEYLGYLRAEGFSWSHANIAKSALVLYYDTNHVDLNSKRIGRSLGEHTISTRDQPYSREQIQRLLEFADLKYKAVILLLSSTSMRLGALADPNDPSKYMKIGDLEPIEDLYRVHVYPDSDKYNYWTYCTPEARRALDTYIQSRSDAGERITSSSPFFRTVFPPEQPNKNVKAVAYDTFKTQIRKYLIKSGLLEKKTRQQTGRPRGKQGEGVQLTAGLRKYGYNMLAKSGVDLEAREIIVGHRSLGVRKHYLRFTDEDLLKQFKMAIPNLTISDTERTKAILDKQTVTLKDELDKEKAHRELAEKELEALKQQVGQNTKQVGDLMDLLKEFHNTKADLIGTSEIEKEVFKTLTKGKRPKKDKQS